MGRFSKLRAPAVGWPVAPPPPPPPPPPEPRPQPRPADRTAPRPVAPVPRSTGPNSTGLGSSAEPRRPTPSGSASPWLPATPDPPAAATTDLAAPAPAPGPAGFRDRARIRRRLRYLRQTRELAFRDLGGFVFDSRRLERPREDIVEAKLKGLLAMDRELRRLEAALDEHQELLLLHEPGITACHRCATIHGSDANFCPSCGLPRQGAPLLLGLRAPVPPAPTGE